MSAGSLAGDLSLRWTVERGLLALASLMFDVAAHILAGHFAEHPDSYEETLRGLHARGVIPEEVYGELAGLGGFRNVLVHEYLEIDLEEVSRRFSACLEAVPKFTPAVLEWLGQALGGGS